MPSLSQIIQLKAGHNGRLADYRSDTCRYVEGRRPWEIEAHIDMALPCATQARVQRSSGWGSGAPAVSDSHVPRPRHRSLAGPQPLLHAAPASAAAGRDRA